MQEPNSSQYDDSAELDDRGSVPDRNRLFFSPQPPDQELFNLCSSINIIVIKSRRTSYAGHA
jgi:hypothetical protein